LLLRLFCISFEMVVWEFLTHTFRHCWEDISFASWKKYPNPSRPDVICVDLLRNEFDAQTGKLRTRRLVTMKSIIPAWLRPIIGASPQGYFVEDAEIDPVNHIMILNARNVSFSQIIETTETCTYEISAENDNWTQLRQECKIRAFPFGIAGKIEEWSAGVFRSNASRGREIMEQAVLKIKAEQQEGLLAMEKFRMETEEKFKEVLGGLDTLKKEGLSAVDEVSNKVKRETQENLKSVIDSLEQSRLGILGAACASEPTRS